MENNVYLKYFKMNLKSFIILTYLKTIRLYSLNSLELKYYNIAWLNSVAASLFSISMSEIFGYKLTNIILKFYKKHYSIARETVSSALSIFYVLFFRFIYYKIFFNKNIVNSKYIQVTIISILSITFYTITIKPLFNNSHNSRFINSIFRDTILLLASDFIEDAKIDSSQFDIEVNTLGTFFRIIINSFFLE